MYQPAHKRLAKLTAIELDRAKADELRDYFWSHKPPEILPPLFDEYVIRITYSAEWIQKILEVSSRSDQRARKYMSAMTHQPKPICSLIWRVKNRCR